MSSVTASKLNELTFSYKPTTCSISALMLSSVTSALATELMIFTSLSFRAFFSASFRPAFGPAKATVTAFATFILAL